MLRGGLAIVVACSCVGTAEADGVRVGADARAAGTLELDGAAENQRAGVVPSMSLLVSHPLGGLVAHGRVRFGIPAYYGQVGAGGGLGVEVPVSRAREVLAFALAEAGVQITYFDAPPELPEEADALVYWGPYGRVEAGIRWLYATPNGRAVGVVLSAGATLVDARFLANASGGGRRLEPDAGIGGEVRF